MKIPPRYGNILNGMAHLSDLSFDSTMFLSQVIATVIAGTVQLGVQSWMFTNIPDICSPTQKDGFICPSTEVFGTASIIWGVIGPARQFSKGQVYYGKSFRGLCLVLLDEVDITCRLGVLLPHRRPVPAHHLSLESEISQELAALCQVSRLLACAVFKNPSTYLTPPSASRSSSAAPDSSHLRAPSTTSPGPSSGSSSSMSSVGAILAGGQSTITFCRRRWILVWLLGRSSSFSVCSTPGMGLLRWIRCSRGGEIRECFFFLFVGWG